MKDKKVIIPSAQNNGNLHTYYKMKFNSKILVTDKESYAKVIDYLKTLTVKEVVIGDFKERTYYLLDERGKQVVRANRLERTLFFTKEVEGKVRQEIGKILY